MLVDRLIEVHNYESRKIVSPESSNIELSLVVPTFNESSTVSKLLMEVQAELKKTGIENFEIIVVDDDSPDRTWEIALSLTEKIPELLVIRRIGTRGLVTAVICGWNHSKGKLLAVMDGDGQHPTSAIADLHNSFKNKEHDVAIASRYLEAGSIKRWSFVRRLLSKGAQTLGLLLLPGAVGKVTDPMSGYFMVKRSALENVELDPVGYKILLEVLARCHTKTVMEIPYVFLDRTAGKSKVAAKQYANYLRHLLRLRIHPLRSRALLRYLLVTGGALLLDAAIFITLFDVQGWNLTRSAAISGEAGILFTILLHDLWTFAGRPARTFTDRIRRLVGVHLALGVLMFLRLLAINAFVNWFNISPIPAFLITLTVVMPGGHLLGSRFTWRTSRV